MNWRVVAAALTVVLVASGCRGAQPNPIDPSPASPSASPPGTSSTRLVVHKVVDGDTLRLTNGQRVRLVGINAPEIRDCGGEQATAALQALTPAGTEVQLQADTIQPARDQYQRLLGYVTVDGQDVGLALVSQGWAEVSYQFDRKPAYTKAAKAAHQAGRGLASACPR